MKRRRPSEYAAGVQAFLNRIAPRHLPALHRIAKDPKRGLRPFFSDPRAMVVLRDMASKANHD